MLARTSIDRPARIQAGATVVEFAIIALMFFTIVIGIMELGRAMYLWNTVQEITRNAARLAVVRDFTTAVPGVQKAAVFQPGAAADEVYLPASGEITNLKVSITYLNASMNPADPLPIDPADNLSACADAGRTSSCIRYVRAQVCVANEDGSCACTPREDGSCPPTPVQFVPMTGLFSSFLGINLPTSTVVMPAESLGYLYNP